MISETRHATVLLDFTDFGDSDTFCRLLNKHRLRYGGVREDGCVSKHVWVSIDGENIELRTSCNPIDGDHVSPLAHKAARPGYASRVQIAGDATRAESVLRDVVSEAESIKSVEQELTAEDGTVLLDVSEEFSDAVRWSGTSDA